MVNKIIQSIRDVISQIEEALPQFSWLLFFGIEIYVFFRQFIGFSIDTMDKVFWFAVAIGVLIYHIIVVMQIKTRRRNKQKTGGYWVAYILFLVMYVFAAVTYSMKTIEKKAYNNNFTADRRESLSETITENRDAIKEYNRVVIITNDIGAKLKFRNLINQLNASNELLYVRAEAMTNSRDDDMDSFKMVASKTGVNRTVYLIVFLLALLGVMELSLFFTAPYLPEKWQSKPAETHGEPKEQKKKPEEKPKEPTEKAGENRPEMASNQQVDPNVKAWIKRDTEKILLYIDALMDIKPGWSRLNSNEVIREKRPSIGYTEADVYRKILNNLKLITSKNGNTEANCSAEEMKEKIKQIAEGK